MLIYIQQLLICLFIVSVTGYILAVLKEKFYLKNNMIVIENKNVTQMDLDEADIKEFVINGEKVRSGDEIEVVTIAKNKFKGTLIGIIRKEKSVLMVTYKNELKKIRCRKDFKI